MKTAIIFHGTGCTPNSYWYPWIATRLHDRGYTVEIPSYPDINHIPIEEFLSKVLKNHTFDTDTILIGHSAGGPLILSILENIGVVIPQAILVAGFVLPLPGDPNPVLQDRYDWEKIKTHVKDITFINSVNDPWGCDDNQGRHMFDHLGVPKLSVEMVTSAPTPTTNPTKPSSS